MKSHIMVVCLNRSEFDSYCALLIEAIKGQGRRIRQSANELVIDGIRHHNVFDREAIRGFEHYAYVEWSRGFERPDIAKIRQEAATRGVFMDITKTVAVIAKGIPEFEAHCNGMVIEAQGKFKVMSMGHGRFTLDNAEYIMIDASPKAKPFKKFDEVLELEGVSDMKDIEGVRKACEALKPPQ